MKPSIVAVLASALLGGWVVQAADATSPVDATQRNTPYAPAATVSPDKQMPAEKGNSRVQERKFETSTVDRRMAPVAGRQSAIEVQETRDKPIIEKDSRRPEVKEQPTSRYNHREAAIATGSDTTKPPTVTKYQDSLTAASASNMARFPALDKATSAKINRFVFRKNAPEAAGALEGAAVTPAAGGSPIQK